MNVKNIDELTGDPMNPRQISKEDFEALKKSIKEFGDLSGIVLNVRTGNLVGGHQRIEAFKRLGGEKKVVITQRFDQPDSTLPPTNKGTIAIGYVDYENEQYSYREVDWSLEKQRSANIAANRIQGQFDLDLLAQVNYEILQAEGGAELLDLTGQREAEINKLMQVVGAVEGPEISQDQVDQQTCGTCGQYIKANHNAPTQ